MRTTCSVGWACYPFMREQPGRLAWEQVMAVADRAMYMAKEHRNAWVGLVSTPTSVEATELFDGIQNETESMIRNGELAIRSSVARKLVPSA